MISGVKKNAVLATVAAIMLAGCASKGEVYAPQARDSAQIDGLLSDAALKAAEAQERLARIQTARTAPTPSALDESGLPDELKVPATIDWSGPASEAAKRVADLIGYSFKITGNPPPIPPSVHISMTDEPAAKVLENIGLQAFPFGEVSVDPNIKRVEFRYLQAQQQPRSPRGTSPVLGK